MKSVLIFGVGGQDGSYLAEVCLGAGYRVYGVYRHSSVDNLFRLRETGVLEKIQLIRGDITSVESVANAYRESKPDLVFNMADQDNVRWSGAIPSYQFDVTLKGAMNVVHLCPETAGLFIPVSATIFGYAKVPQTEKTPLNPQTPYAIAKAALLQYLRWACPDNVFAGIMFNHDSPRRARGYALDLLIDRAMDVKSGKSQTLDIENPYLVVDIGYAEDFMCDVLEAMETRKWGYREQCFGTGHLMTILDWATLICEVVGIPASSIQVVGESSQPCLLADFDGQKSSRRAQCSPRRLVEMLYLAGVTRTQ